jgi:hypothetical protein
MPSFEHIRDRLPSLYQPEDFDTGGQLVPLSGGDVLELNGQPPPAGAGAEPGGSFVVNSATPLEVRQVRLASGRAPGSGYSLAFFPIEGGLRRATPAVVATVRNNIARLADPFRGKSFAIQLWRGSLFTLLLRGIGAALDDADRQTEDVLRSHWFAYADAALFSPFFRRSRQLSDPAHFPPQPGDPAFETFPYIHDLARLGALIPTLPWLEPPDQREVVEAYRERIGRMVALYRNGLGTVDALRRIVEAELPQDMAAPLEHRDHSFEVAEFVPLTSQQVAVEQPGAPVEMVGPLMRWTLINDGIVAAAPTVYIQGVTPQADAIDATTDPLIELYAAAPGGSPAGRSSPRLGIAYRGTIAPGQALRLRPAYASWLARADGLARADSGPGQAADPSAPGPWAAVQGGPADAVRAIAQTDDRSLWVAAAQAGTDTLWRYDGQTWTAVVSGLPQVHCLVEDAENLLAGTERGVLRLPLYPASGTPFTPDPAPAALDGPAVYALHPAQDGAIWAGTATGAARIIGHTSPEGHGIFDGPLNATPLQGTAVHAITEDRAGTLYLGTDLGLFQYQPAADRWFWYTGGEHTEQALDWQPATLTDTGLELPKPAQVFLPAVLSAYRGPDASLWLGTARGLARYVAHPVAGLIYETVLEAYPDLTDGPVTAICEDERGRVWFGTDRGLFYYDGRDLFQHRAGQWVGLGRAGAMYVESPDGSRSIVERGSWRFVRQAGQWQRFGAPSQSPSGRSAAGWIGFTGSPRSSEEAAVFAVYWTDLAAADLGTWDGTNFSSPAAVPGTDLMVRYKPSDDRILNGGLPAVPRLPPGISTWRYLSLEPDGADAAFPPQARPAWTVEGRLLLPPPGETALPGRHDLGVFGPAGRLGLDDSVFAHHPAARVWFAWEPRLPLTVMVRLARRENEQIAPIILDRVWQGIQQVRPAGVRAVLAVENDIVRGM